MNSRSRQRAVRISGITTLSGEDLGGDDYHDSCCRIRARYIATMALVGSWGSRAKAVLAPIKVIIYGREREGIMITRVKEEKDE